MYNQNTIKNVDIPANLFSNLGSKKYIPSKELEGNSLVKTNNLLAEDMKEYYESGDIKLNKLNNQRDYRTRLENMYKNLNELDPIDNEVSDTLFTNHYVEKGIVIKPTISEFKQFWTEYRLMNNEQKVNPSINVIETPTNIYTETKDNNKEFDELFNKLTIKVEEINKYIDELKEMKKEIDRNNESLLLDKQTLEQNKSQLELDKQEFLNYKQEEEKKIRKEKEELKINFNKLQTIIDSLKNKLEEVE